MYDPDTYVIDTNNGRDRKKMHSLLLRTDMEIPFSTRNLKTVYCVHRVTE